MADRMAGAQITFLYVTTRNTDEALAIGRTLVEERLAAGVNILDGLRSLYWWGGAVQDAAEAAFIAKTRSDLVPGLIARVKELHSYKVPCVVALAVVDGNPDFLDWVETETRLERQHKC